VGSNPTAGTIAVLIRTRTHQGTTQQHGAGQVRHRVQYENINTHDDSKGNRRVITAYVLRVITAYVLRVFTNDQGNFGNQVGIIVDEGRTVAADVRQKVAVELGYSESVFINDLSSNNISFFTPMREIPFAGHAAVGTAWLIKKLYGRAAESLLATEGTITTREENDITWVRSELRSTPTWWHERLDSANTIELLTGPQDESQTHTQLWAWIDEGSGKIRSRTFAAAWGIPEDEANGSGCMRLAAALGRRIEVIHGQGSIIFSQPGTPGSADVGGYVIQDASREIDTTRL
jgi:predicted PhzF superfamily epimerase YddE/YHI9